MSEAGGLMSVASALYEGTVAHVRYGEAPHRFCQRVQMWYVDTEEISRGLLSRGLLATGGPGPVQLRSRDYGARSWAELADEARATAKQATGGHEIGPVRLLVHPRTWGWSFTPLALKF